MVICVKNFRVFAVIIIALIFLSAKPTKCQISATEEPPIILTEEPVEGVSEEVENIQKIPGEQEYFFETDLRPRTAAPTEGQDAEEQSEVTEGEDYSSENSPTYENGSYEEFYDDNEDDVCQERTYGRFLLIGSGVLLVLGLCGIICFTKKKDEGGNSCPSVTTCFRACKVEDEHDDEACVVNFMKAPSPDLSDSESDYQNIPLPLIYEDMGKICNNAEMFIQRCMTSSVKRTYSEPVKTLTSSRTKFRDYIKELAYLKQRQNQECTKHGALRAFFKEMFKVFKRSELADRRKRHSADNTINPAKETRVKIEDSTKDVLVTRKVAKTTKPAKKKERASSSSISITSLLLKPKYQCKYYKKENTFDKYKSRKRNNEKERKGEGDNKSDGENLPLMMNQKTPTKNIGGRRLEFSKDLRQHKICAQDTEELIKMCVNTMRQPFNKKFVTLFDQQNMEQFNGLQDVAATMALKMGVEEQRNSCEGDAGRGPREPYLERKYCLPSSSREMTPLKPKQSKEAVETFDLLVKHLYFMTTNNRNLPNSEPGTFIVPHEHGPQGDSRAVSTDFSRDYSNSTEEEARTRMLRKYQELQMEVERLNRSLRQFADDFLFSGSSRKAPYPYDNVRKKEHHSHRGSKKR